MESDRGRSRRLVAGVVGLAFFAGAVWLVTTGGAYRPVPRPTPEPTEPSPALDAAAIADPDVPITARVGFVGLPPQGAAPSRPRHGELVLSYFGEQFTHWYEVWVYADGRLIWQREGNLREGANELSTGYLEQRLSPEGVELLRRRGSAEAALFGFPWRPPYPASWLPPSAWDDRTIRPYVAARYAVCYQALWRPVEPARILSRLPARAATLLRGAAFDPTVVDGWMRRFGGGCSRVTTGEARVVAGALAGAGFRQDEEFQTAYALTYYLAPRGAVRNEIAIRFEPILPHGEVACTSCGDGRRLEAVTDVP